jgi:molybdopterin-synthase adenylyltransferase
MDSTNARISRYHRQTLLPFMGEAGQSKLASSRVLLVGCGALGTVIAEQLVRAGVRSLRIIDRDIVELTNLQRQVLFDERDVSESLPKAVAAERRLRAINSTVQIEAIVADLHSGNIENLSRDVTLILDGTDNAPTRYLINDLAVKRGLPWVYGACVAAEGRVMAITPTGPCLRCVFPQPPAVGELPTCDTAGVLAPAAAVVASLQVTAAIKILTAASPPPELLTLDVWTTRFHTLDLTDARRTDCLCCQRRQFEFLDHPSDSEITLCGRNAVQIRHGANGFDLKPVVSRLRTAGTVEETPFFVRCKLQDPAGMSLTVFPDGRLIVAGTNDLGRARSIGARFIG